MRVEAKRGRGRCPAIPHPLRDRAHARPAILDAARKLFKNEPYHSISVERIAAVAQVTRHTLTNHFTSKEEIFKCSRELLLADVIKSIKHDGEHQRWLMEAHQRRIRFRLIRDCETYLLYRASHAEILLSNPQIIAEQLLMTAESVVYGPYVRNNGNAQTTSWRAKQFNVAARAVASLLCGQEKSPMISEGAAIICTDPQIG
jgi:AcrR family transcriptional regulator